MKVANLIHLYRVRLRARLVQELFALAGVAVGVALLFSSQVAQESLSGSVRALQQGIAGKARYELVARGPQGFTEAVTKQVSGMPGVAQVAPVLETSANVSGPDGQRPVDLIGADARIISLGGSLLRHVTGAQLEGAAALALPSSIADTIGVPLYGTFTLQVAGKNFEGFLGKRLDNADIGDLTGSPIAIAPLFYVQQLTGFAGRASRLLVEPKPGQDLRVHTELERLATGRFDVRDADFEASLVDQAALATNESTELFSAICALVGFLFAFNAIRMTLTHRRRLIDDLRLDGYSPRALLQILLMDAFVLGALASVLGLALGEALSNRLFGASADYLSLAFPIGSERVIGWQSIPIAVLGGLLVTFASVLAPFQKLYDGPLRVSLPGRVRVRNRNSWMVAGGCALTAISTAMVLIDPAIAAIATGVLTVALLLLLPSLIRLALRTVAWLGRDAKKPALLLALMELRSSTTRSRSVAVAATGAIAVFSTVAIEGARTNLQAGLNQTTHGLTSVANVWVTPRGSASLGAVTPLHPIDLAPLQRLPGVEAIRIYRSGLLDWGDRRLWVIAPPPQASNPIPAGEIVQGNVARATGRVRSSGWVVLTRTVAEEHHLHLGQSFTLPSPSPTRFRVAALSTNIDWPPGAIIMNSEDYARAWSTQEPSAYNIILDRGASTAQVSREVQGVLAGQSGLVVQTAHQREQRLLVVVSQAVSRVAQIALLVLIAAVLSMCVAMGDLLWQRRGRLAAMKVDGMREGVLWRALLLESALLLGCGCTIGALFGIYAQPLLGYALANVTGFPVVFYLRLALALEMLVLVSAVAVAILAIPGRAAARVSPRLSLGD
jgi:putative ABC transport system permease protein